MMMDLPPSLQQKAEQWAHSQGTSLEQFITQAVAEKVNRLDQQLEKNHLDEAPESEKLKVYYKGSVLVVEAEPIDHLDINALINDAREERMRRLMTW